MQPFNVGDLVKQAADGPEMLIVDVAERTTDDVPTSFLCVWEDKHFLYQEVVVASALTLVRQERRKFPRAVASRTA